MPDFSTKMRDKTATKLITKYGLDISFRKNYPKVTSVAAGTTVSIVYKSGTTIAAVSDGFTDTANEFLTKGFAVGQVISILGFTATALNTTFTIASVTANKITTTVAPSTTEAALNTIKVEAKYIAYACKGVLQNYKDKDVDGTIIKNGDMQVLLSATYLNSLGVVQILPIAPSTKDILIIQNNVWQIVYNRPLRPAGIDIMYEIQVRT